MDDKEFDFTQLHDTDLLEMMSKYAKPTNTREVEMLAAAMREYHGRIDVGAIKTFQSLDELAAARGAMFASEYVRQFEALLIEKYGIGIPGNETEAGEAMRRLSPEDAERLLELLENRADRGAVELNRETRDIEAALSKINARSCAQVIKLGAAGSRPIRVFTVTTALQTGASDEDKKRFKSVQNRLVERGLYRPLARVTPADIDNLEALQKAFPNFADVLDSVVLPHAKICARNANHRMPPVLLVGPPGVGKTHFANSVAAALSVPILRVDMASSQNNSDLAGSSAFWSNSSPGRLFNLLLEGTDLPPTANPVVFVDELDKASGSGRYNPLSPLYSLLEPHSAKHFEDLSVPGLQVDASHVRWVFSANKTEDIPAPILSRLLVFEIEPPTPQEMRRILQTIAKNAAIGLDSDFDPTLGDDMISDLETMPPRTARLCIETAVSIAAADDHDHVTRDAWRTAMRAVGRRERRISMGFV